MNKHLEYLENVTVNEEERYETISDIETEFSNGEIGLFELNNASNNGIITNEEYDRIISY